MANVQLTQSAIVAAVTGSATGVQLTQSAIVGAIGRAAAGVQLTQSTIIIAARRYRLIEYLEIVPPIRVPNPRMQVPPVLD